MNQTLPVCRVLAASHAPRRRTRTALAAALLLAATLSLAAGPPVFAEEQTGSSPTAPGASTAAGADSGTADATASNAASDDDLFSADSGSMVEEISPEQEAASLEERFLTAESVEIGGRYSLSLISSWNWDADRLSVENLPDPDEATQDADLQATLYFDARPDPAFRVFGKVLLAYPFVGSADRSFSDVIRITELFSDFNFRDRLFVRAGKHTINWGVGYFFSPADVLNLTPIDPEDPTADREGPVSVAFHLPVGTDNLYLYVISNDVTVPWDLAVASKAEVVAGLLEAAAGLFYRNGLAPRATVTATVATGELTLLAEGVVSYGSDRVFLETGEDPLRYPLGVSPFTVDDRLFFSATAGFRYTHTDSGLSVAVQYLFNGEGYREDGIFRDYPAGIAALLASGEISPGDLLQRGRHYAAASFLWREIGDSPLSVSLFWISNLADLSGKVTPQLSWELFDRFTLSLSAPVRYGNRNDEFTPGGTVVGLSVSARMGAGSF